MKKSSLFLFFAICFFSIARSQSYNNPESIVYDKVGERYFISNKLGNTIVQLDSDENLSNFVTTGLNEPKGLLILGDTLISVNSKSIQGFLLSNATRVLNISVAGSMFMNDVTTDGKGNLYISDSQKDVVYKLEVKSGAYSTLISSGVNPNGLLFDEPNNSILICNNGANSKIESFNLSDSSITTLITTNITDLDGLARDSCGNIYVSSWAQSAVYVFDPLFNNSPIKISSGHNGPADITINQKDQILAIPNFLSNSISLKQLDLSPKEETSTIIPANMEKNFRVFPNPAKRIIYVEINNSNNPYNFWLTDLTGKIVVQEMLNSKTIDISKLKKGVYIIHCELHNGTRFNETVLIN